MARPDVPAPRLSEAPRRLQDAVARYTFYQWVRRVQRICGGTHEIMKEPARRCM